MGNIAAGGFPLLGRSENVSFYATFIILVNFIVFMKSIVFNQIYYRRSKSADVGDVGETKPCPQCGSQVSVKKLTCPVCGQGLGKVKSKERAGRDSALVTA